MVLVIILAATQAKPNLRAIEVAVGILIGLPCVTYLAGSQIKLPFNNLLGELSYGLFLSHFLAIWIIEQYSLINKSSDPYSYVIAVFAISSAISFSGVFIIERKVRTYRFKFSKSTQQRTPKRDTSIPGHTPMGDLHLS